MIFNKLKIIATKLNLASNEMSNNIKHIEEKLRYLDIGVQCFITLPDNTRLGYSRFNKHWCLVVKKDDEQWSLLQAPRHLRVLSIQHIPDLLESMVEATKAAIIRVEKSAKTAKEIMEAIK